MRKKAPMPRVTVLEPQPDADAAINLVLLAEEKAREAIKRCEVEAARRVSDARTRARHITVRTDERISKLRARCEQLIGRKLTELRDSARAVDTLPAHDDERSERLHAAVERLAAELTGGDERGRR